MKLQCFTNYKSTIETIIKTYEHNPSINITKEHIPKENNDFNIKAGSAGQLNKINKDMNPKKATESDKIYVKTVKLATSVIDSHQTNIINNDFFQVRLSQIL